MQAIYTYINMRTVQRLEIYKQSRTGGDFNEAVNTMLVFWGLRTAVSNPNLALANAPHKKSIIARLMPLNVNRPLIHRKGSFFYSLIHCRMSMACTRNIL